MAVSGILLHLRTETKTQGKTPLFERPSVPDLLQALAQKDQIIAEQQKLLRLLEEKLRLAQIQRFAARSEKLPFQADLFDEAELEVALSELEAQLAETPPAAA